MDNPVVALAFLSIFHIVGAATVAKAVRGLWGGLQDRKLGAAGGALPIVVWGAVFGCLPCSFGLQVATKEGGTPLLLFGEAAIWGSAFVIALLAGDRIASWLRSFFNPDVALIAFGGLFMLTGMGVGILAGWDEPLGGLLAGGLFFLVGGVFFVIGLSNLLRETR